MKICNLYFSVLFYGTMFFGCEIFAQPLPADTLWTKSLGGSGSESIGGASLSNFGMNAAYVAVDTAGNFYAVSYSNSTDGYVGGNAGQNDIWVVKLSGAGDTLWTKRFGGSGDERVYRVRAVSTGGCILVGETQSADGDFTGSHGQTEAFIIRLDAAGNVVFKKLYGGGDQDYLYDIAENPEGNFVACGESNSSDGDLAGVGSGLAWALFINGSDGTKTNSVTFTGPDHSSPDFLENFITLTRLADGSGYLAAGYTTPEFNDFNKDNIWVEKFNASGVSVWSKKYGSVTAGDYPAALLDAGAGSYYIVGSTSASGGDNTAGYYGGPTDGWLIKCDASGSMVWNKHFGGSDWDVLYDAVIQPSGNLLLSGFTRSMNNDLAATTPYGLTDYWLLQLTDTGGIVNMYRVGGSQADVGIGMAYDAVRNKIVMVGRSESNDGYVQGNLGGRDLWVVCFGEQALGFTDEPGWTQVDVFPNPAVNSLSVKSKGEISRLGVLDISGREVLSKELTQMNSQTVLIDITHLAPGFYYLKIFGDKVSVQPFVKTK